MSEHAPAVSSLVFRDTHFDVIDRNGKPWLRLPQVGLALGYANPYKVQQVYDRHSDEFVADMTAVVELPTNGGPQRVRIFSLRGAHLLAMFARTDVAKAFRRWLLDVLDGLARPALPAPPVPAPAAYTSPAFLDFRYNRRPLRITRLAGSIWYGSSGVARALGWVDSADITRYMGGAAQMRVVPHRGRKLMVIDHPTMLEAAERAKPQHALPFLRWLDRVLRSHFGAEAPALPSAVDPLERVTGDGRQLAIDYLGECRQILARAGEPMPALSAEAAERVADGMAAQLLANRRWVLSFDEDGLPNLKGLRAGTVLLHLDDTDHLAQLLREQVPAEALPSVLDAGLRRLGTLALPSR